ncbi:ATP-binding cassette domain-containing protein [Candidatus Dojkabacteria bacterium]|nr:ATP-binding cassette domain-containing protein [Candidatus Dojkabacteria bacterium]
MAKAKDLIIQAKNLKKIYNGGKQNEVRAVDDVDIKIEKGEVVAIMGPSGSGKTTLLNVISGIDEATSGEIIIDGQDLQKMGDRKKTKYRATKMGFIFQTFNLIPVLSALENVQMPPLISGDSGKESKEKALEMLDVVGLKERANHRPAELSGGQRQRVTIARALVHNPAVIWADEPTGNLDRETAFEVFDLILKLNKELDQTTVVVTHDEEIAKKTERIIKMESGKIIN